MKKEKWITAKLTDLAGEWTFKIDPYPLRFNSVQAANQRWLDMAHPIRKPTTTKPNA